MTLTTIEIKQPIGSLVLRTLAMPESTNAAGHIFGGWIMSQVDLAGGILAKEISQSNIVTVCVNSMTFDKPILVGDVVCCYATCLKTGTTSMTIALEVWVKRLQAKGGFIQKHRISEAELVYVAIDELHHPKALPLTAQHFDASIHPISQLNLSSDSA